MQDTTNARLTQVEEYSFAMQSTDSFLTPTFHLSSSDLPDIRQGYYLLADLLCHVSNDREQMIQEGQKEYFDLLPYFPNYSPLELYECLNQQTQGSKSQMSLF